MKSAVKMDDLIRQVLRQELGLGFQDAYRVPLDVEAGTTEDGRRYCWGVFDHDRQVFVPELRNALVGYLQGVGVKKGNEYKGKVPQKLIVHMSCGAKGSYSIKSGLETAFSKSILSEIASLEKPAEPVKLVVKPGEDGKVVLPSLYLPQEQGDVWVKPVYEYPADIGALRAVFRAAVEVVPKLDLRSWEEKQAQEAA